MVIYSSCKHIKFLYRNLCLSTVNECIFISLSFSNMDIFCFCFRGWNSPLVSEFKFKLSKLDVSCKVLGTSLTISYFLTNQHTRNSMHFRDKSRCPHCPILTFTDPNHFVCFLFSSHSLLFINIALYGFYSIFFIPHPTVTSMSPIAQIRGDCFHDGSWTVSLMTSHVSCAYETFQSDALLHLLSTDRTPS